MIPSPKDLLAEIKADHENLAWAREQRRKNLIEFCGRHSSKGDGKQRIVNLVNQAHATLRPNLVSRDPEATVRPRIGRYGLESELLKNRLDQRIRNTRVVQAVGEAIDDCVFGGTAVLRVGVKAGKELARTQRGERWVSETYCETIDLDDVAFDRNARKDDEAERQSHRARVNRQVAQTRMVYGRDPEEFGPDDAYLAELVMTREEAAVHLTGVASMDENQEEEGLRRKPEGPNKSGNIELWDGVLWCDGDCYDFTVSPEEERKFLRLQRWTGPEWGPYFNVRLINIRNELAGLPFCSVINDLHEAVKMLSGKMVKLLDQARRFGLASRDNADDALTLRKALNGGFYLVDDPKSATSIDAGGVPTDWYPGLQWLMGAFNQASGNVSLIGGLEGLSDTATESQILQGAAMIRLRDMQRQLREAVRDATRAMAWYEWMNPMANWQVQLQTPAGPVDWQVTPQDREADAFEAAFDIDVEEDSMQDADPVVRQRRVIEFLAVFMEMLPGMQAGIINPHGMVTLGRREFGIRGLDDVVNDPERAMELQLLQQGMQPQGGQAQLAGGGMAAGLGAQPGNVRPGTAAGMGINPSQPKYGSAGTAGRAARSPGTPPGVR